MTGRGVTAGRGAYLKERLKVGRSELGTRAHEDACGGMQQGLLWGGVGVVPTRGVGVVPSAYSEILSALSDVLTALSPLLLPPGQRRGQRDAGLLRQQPSAGGADRRKDTAVSALALMARWSARLASLPLLAIHRAPTGAPVGFSKHHHPRPQPCVPASPRQVLLRPALQPAEDARDHRH